MKGHLLTLLFDQSVIITTLSPEIHAVPHSHSHSSRQAPGQQAGVQEGQFKEDGEQQLGNKPGDYRKNPGWHRTPSTVLVEKATHWVIRDAYSCQPPSEDPDVGCQQRFSVDKEEKAIGVLKSSTSTLKESGRGVCFWSHGVGSGVLGVAAFSPFIHICTVCGIQGELPQEPQCWDLYILINKFTAHHKSQAFWVLLHPATPQSATVDCDKKAIFNQKGKWKQEGNEAQLNQI
ncbi:uncharacterized protein LOC120433223 [Oreochromis aureus]|uniref:uncharacterized protein LOC120433223 n=1 Tax=Oreochromis aureus TaxID=47969 RepID=UPI001954D5AA|nr:uncharacterized protein LOC120433223 [Oreochromis aureus]